MATFCPAMAELTSNDIQSFTEKKLPTHIYESADSEMVNTFINKRG